MKNRGFKAISSFCRSDSGVSTAVAAALLIGVLVAFMTTVQINYMPVWKEDAEYAHMSDVWHDMSRFKSNIDILTAGLVINDDVRIVMNSPIAVGGSEVPFIRSTTTGGTLAINKDMSGLSAIMEHNGSTFNTGTSLYYTGTVSYRPSNLHYVRETYCYENGALIVSQDGRSIMKLAPGIILEKDINNSVNLLVRAVYLDGERGVMSSNTVEDIRLTSEGLLDVYPVEEGVFTNVSSANLTVYTENTEAWEGYFENSAEDINLQSEDYNLSNSTYSVTFYLHPQDEDLYVDIDKAVIQIEAGIQ